MSTCTAPSESRSRIPPASGKRLTLALLAVASIGLGGCVSPYYPSGVVYSPAPGPSSGTTSPSQVVHSVQVPQASLPANGGYSVAEILAQVKEGRPLVELAAEIRSRGLNAPLKQADVDMLATNGVPKEVVDAALAAPVNTATVENPQVVTRSYYYYPWVPLTLGMYWGAWRPFHYPYYNYAPRPWGFWGHSAPRYFGHGSFGAGVGRGSFGHGGVRSLPPSGWGSRGSRTR